MRLTERERRVIRAAVTEHFGEDALRAKIDTITDIQLAIGDQKIDLVVDGPAPQSARNQ